jgi:hypothetical protein
MEQREGIREWAVNTDGKGPPGSRREWARARGTRRQQIGPTGSEREREGGEERGCERLLTGGVHLSGDVGASTYPGWAD